jgi:hypothetical protein
LTARASLSEFGIIAAKGIGRVDELLDLVESEPESPLIRFTLGSAMIGALMCLGDRARLALGY